MLEKGARILSLVVGVALVLRNARNYRAALVVRSLPVPHKVSALIFVGGFVIVVTALKKLQAPPART
jgi:hypothetical protein